jgi:hypothetical protein
MYCRLLIANLIEIHRGVLETRNATGLTNTHPRSANNVFALRTECEEYIKVPPNGLAIRYLIENLKFSGSSCFRGFVLKIEQIQPRITNRYVNLAPLLAQIT